MPALSPTMTKGGVTSWLVSEGQKVSAGDVLAEIQTDKATMEMESMEDGFVAKILIEAGREDIDVGTPLLVMVEDEKDVASFKEYVGGKGGGDDSGGSFNDSGSEAEETRKEEERVAASASASTSSSSSSSCSRRGVRTRLGCSFRRWRGRQRWKKAWIIRRFEVEVQTGESRI